MSLFIASINSGSNGNCYYIGTNKAAVLIDVGISCREVEKRMLRLGLSIHLVKAIFISHEHSDHIKGVEVLSRKYKVPVYITTSTLSDSKLKIDPALLFSFQAYKPVSIDELSVLAFPKFHDASDPHSFIVRYNQIKVGILTDIGSSCKHVIDNFKQCHAAFLEANYDDQLLAEGSYPFYLKQRISGNNGHLSNHQALALFTAHKPAFMSHLLLSHLSKSNNCPTLVQELFVKHAGKTKIVVMSRDEESEVFQIDRQSTRVPKSRKRELVVSMQLSLF